MHVEIVGCLAHTHITLRFGLELGVVGGVSPGILARGPYHNYRDVPFVSVESLAAVCVRVDDIKNLRRKCRATSSLSLAALFLSLPPPLHISLPAVQTTLSSLPKITPQSSSTLHG
jgi:hypothetical protein